VTLANGSLEGEVRGKQHDPFAIEPPNLAILDDGRLQKPKLREARDRGAIAPEDPRRLAGADQAVVRRALVSSSAVLFSVHDSLAKLRGAPQRSPEQALNTQKY
jgi:hypothetical protein